MRTLKLIPAAFLAAALAACGSDDGTSPDTGLDAAPDTDAADVDPGDADESGFEEVGEPDVAPDVAADSDAEGSETGEPEECPASISCIDETSGNPSLRICTAGGFPEGTICERRSEGVACCLPPFACETDADCEANREAEGFCLDDRFPCVCDVPTQKCGLDVCSSNDECAEGEACFDGLCEPAPDAATFVARILTPGGVIAPGETVALLAVAVDASNPRIVHPSTPITWSIDTGVGAAVTDAGVLTAGTARGAITVRARVAANAADRGATVTFTGMGEVVAGSRITVVDAESRAPVVNARVSIDGSEVLTDDEGVAYFEHVPPYDVHVFAAGYAYASVLGVNGDDTLVPIPSNQRAIVDEIRDGLVCEAGDEDLTATADESGCGGPGQPFCLCYQLENVDVVKGEVDFSSLPDTGSLAVSISGFSLGASLLDVNFDLIVGPSIRRVFPEGSPLPLDDVVEIPSGVTLQFNGQRLIDNYVLTGGAGNRSVWTIGGLVPLNDVLLDILPSLSGSLDIGRVIAAVLPYFDEFYSGVTEPLPLSADGTFPVRDPGITLSVPTQRRVSVEMPELPQLATGWVDTGIVLGGALVPGEGFVPLGITGGTDDISASAADGFVDGDTRTDGLQPLRISMAPAHSAVAGPHSTYAFAHVALQIGERADAPREAAAGVVTRLSPGTALSGTYAASSDFPPIPVGSAWDDETRTLTIESHDAEFDFLRLVFKNRTGYAWVVYAPGDATSVTLPALPAGFGGDDRGDNPRINVVGVQLIDGAPDYDALVAANATSFADVFEFLAAFSVIGL